MTSWKAKKRWCADSLKLATFFVLTAAALQSSQAQTFTVLHAFTGGLDGAYPYATLLVTNEGLCGTTSEGGGASVFGTVFRMNAKGEEFVLHSFSGGTDGDGPNAGVVLDSAGNLYGTTVDGGTLGVGTVFKLDTTGTETVLYSFTGGTDGSQPVAGLVTDSAGNLYGTTYHGGGSATCFNGCGIVFKVDTSESETVLYRFTGGEDGGNPQAGLITDSAGNLYGTTLVGGTSSYGTVFKLDTSGSESVLHSFAGRGDGISPEASLVMDSAGNLYGTTYYGGTVNLGTVFKVDTGGNETVLYSFGAGGDAGNPMGRLLLGRNGNLYGTTYHGGTSDNGTVFTMNLSGKETVLHSFNGTTDGKNPAAGLARDRRGNLYGTALAGGAHGWGTVFKLTP